MPLWDRWKTNRQGLSWMHQFQILNKCWAASIYFERGSTWIHTEWRKVIACRRSNDAPRHLAVTKHWKEGMWVSVRKMSIQVVADPVGWPCVRKEMVPKNTRKLFRFVFVSSRYLLIKNIRLSDNVIHITPVCSVDRSEVKKEKKV